MARTVLIAIGGNALLRPNERPALGVERVHVAETCRGIADVVADGWRVVLTHGNGPQVGAALLRSERAACDAYPLSLDACVACTQGEIGMLLQQSLAEALGARGLHLPLATVLTQVVVDDTSSGFAPPTKPIGPFFADADLSRCGERGWTMVNSEQGWRRVVPSPEPIEIVETEVIQTLVDSGALVIALGGGGIPVVRRGDGLAGVEAVVDKDLASALLATALGVDRLLLATDVDGVYVDFGTPSARRIETVTSEELRRFQCLDQFPAGSMGPKVEAALRFVDAGGEEAIVASYDRLRLALDGGCGTHVARM